MSLLSPADLDRLARTAVAAVQTEYPHQLDQRLTSDADLRPPRELNPSFSGSYDWHSAVHNHWLLVAALERGLPASTAVAVEEILDRHLSAERVAGELAFFSSAGGRTSERPYGWSWLVLLHARCRAGGHRWADALEPLASLLTLRLVDYVGPTLSLPIRAGTHRNTAFSLQLMLEASALTGDEALRGKVAAAVRRLVVPDRRRGWDDPPSGDAFLDPALTEAAVVADLLEPPELVAWVERNLGAPPAWTPPEFSPDGEDPATVHLEGLLASRAWCLHELATALPSGHPVAGAAAGARDAHLRRVAALDPTDGFNRSHWLPTFLLYLDERLRRPPAP